MAFSVINTVGSNEKFPITFRKTLIVLIDSKYEISIYPSPFRSPKAPVPPGNVLDKVKSPVPLFRYKYKLLSEPMRISRSPSLSKSASSELP